MYDPEKLQQLSRILSALKLVQTDCFAHTIAEAIVYYQRELLRLTQSALQPMRVLIERDWVDFCEPKFHLGQLVRTPYGPGAVTGICYDLEAKDWRYHCDPHPANEEWLGHCEDGEFPGRELQAATRTEIDRLVLLSPELQEIADQISNRFSCNGGHL